MEMESNKSRITRQLSELRAVELLVKSQSVF